MNIDMEILKIVVLLVAGFALAAALGKYILPRLRMLEVGQEVRSDGPKSHYKKSGTPTFGGAIFLSAFMLLAIIGLIINYSLEYLLILMFILLHAGIGFADDYIKVRIDKKGLSAKSKTIFLLLIESIFIGIFLFGLRDSVRMVLPFSLGVLEISGLWKILYGLFLLFYFYACTNAVNITDGVDGLASTVSVITFLFIALTVLIKGENASENSLSLWYAASFAGALLGFLLYNWHKAKVFMGDFGSLAIGAAISVLLLQEEIPFAFVLAGIIYVIEIGSVFIQVQYFKRTGGKRIFRMSPIHHHYELGGWKEVKIVWVFAIVQLIGSVIAALSFWPALR